MSQTLPRTPIATGLDIFLPISGSVSVSAKYASRPAYHCKSPQSASASAMSRLTLHKIPGNRLIHFAISTLR